MMKKALALLLFLTLLLDLLSGCGRSGDLQTDPEKTDLSAPELVNAACAASGRDSAMRLEFLNEQEDAGRLAAYIEAVCALTADQWEDAAVARGTGASAFEVIAVCLPDAKAAGELAAALKDYISSRETAFTGYAPAEAEMASHGRIKQLGSWVGLFICPDPEAAEAAFTAAYNGEIVPEPAPLEAPEAEVGSILDFLLAQCGDVPADLEHLDGGDPDALAGYLNGVYGIPEILWKEAALVHGDGFEIAVLRVGDRNASSGVMNALADYLDQLGAPLEMPVHDLVTNSARIFTVMAACPNGETAFGKLAAALPPNSSHTIVRDPEAEDYIFRQRFELRDLLFRVLIESACPDWRARPTNERGWDSLDFGMLSPSVYGAAEDQYLDFVIAFWGPDTQTLIADGDMICYSRCTLPIFLAASEENAVDLARKMDDFRMSRAEELRETDPETAALWEEAQSVCFGRYAALIVTEYSAEEAVQVFYESIEARDTTGYFMRWASGPMPAANPDPDYPDRVLFTPPNEEDMTIYDTSAILAAWEAKDPSSLSGDDREIYDEAEKILADILEDGMTDLEKETAVYRWVVNNVNYDWGHMDVLAGSGRRAYGPYGGLVDRAAVCLGYASTFQLLMDMSGVECLTIVGACANSTGDHAWNMVKLNDEWYCADPTWDANARELAPEEVKPWKYFNLTSDEMASNHQWDYANTPEATATDRGEN